MDKDINKVADSLASVFKKVFDENQKRPDQYVVAYKRVSDDSVIGYHASTFCNLVQDRLSAKRYAGDNPYGQLDTIHKNVTSVLSVKEGDTGIFDTLKLNIKNSDYKGLSIDDIYLEADYLEDNVTSQVFVFGKVN